jgi:hypothetical protein
MKREITGTIGRFGGRPSEITRGRIGTSGVILFSLYSITEVQELEPVVPFDGAAKL